MVLECVLGSAMKPTEMVFAGVFRKFISENTSLTSFGNELPKSVQKCFFNCFAFFWISIVSGIWQATKHVSDRGERHRQRRLDASVRRILHRRGTGWSTSTRIDR